MIVVFGSINVDLSARPTHLPQPGETVLTDRYDTVCGGKGANQAVAAARALGGSTPVVMAGAVGRDAFGDLSIAELEREGIDASRVARVEAPTGCAFILVDAAGENMIAVAAGANLKAAAAALDGLDLGATDLLVVQMEVPFAQTLAAARLAKAAGARVLANLAPVPSRLDGPTLAQLMVETDILIVNAQEAIAAAAADGLRTHDPRAAAEALAVRHRRTVVVTLGAAGAVAAVPDGDMLIADAPRIAPVDTTGAGDTFVGVLAASLSEKLALDAALARACRAAALSCLAPGARAGMPRRAEL